MAIDRKYIERRLSEIDWFEVYGVLLILSTILSIALMNILLALAILYLVFSFIKGNKISVGRLGKPIISLFLINVLSTILFNPKYLVDSFVETGTLFVYFLTFQKHNKKRAFNILEKSFYGVQILGVVGACVFLYRYLYLHRIKLFWGRAFKSGRFMAIFASNYLLSFMKSFFSKDILKMVLYFSLFITCSFFVILSGKRSFIMALAIIIVFLVFSVGKNLNMPYFKIGLLTLSFVFILSGVIYTLNARKLRLNDLSIGKFSSGRVMIGKDALNIIAKDLKEHKYLTILIGHGENCGAYLPHTGSCKPDKYESFFIISELLEKGILGVVFELWIIGEIFRIFVAILHEYEHFGYYKIILLWGVSPILIHFFGMLFIFFRDPTLPTWFFMVRQVEVILEED